MINPQEHVYDDDPGRGHPDVRTRLKKAAYFFLGNGFIQAAVQWAPGGEGTPVGLAVMNPDLLRPKRGCLTIDPESGLEATTLRFQVGSRWLGPAPGEVRAAWLEASPIPLVHLRWKHKPFRVEERFYCPSVRHPVLAREVLVENVSGSAVQAAFETGLRSRLIRREISLAAGAHTRLDVGYELGPDGREVELRWRNTPGPEAETLKYWQDSSFFSCGSPRLDRFFRAAKFQLPAVVSARGRVDGSLWQYNREWVRDQSQVALALTMLGEWSLGRTILDRLLTEFLSPEGRPVDSSERRDADEVELDQNGYLLSALEGYVRWSGDREIVRAHWPRIAAAAEFPLGPEFRHEPSGLLVNRREFWERHGLHGIAPGLEMAHQLWTSLGLAAAASLARASGREDKASFWEAESARLKTAMLDDPEFGLVDGGRLIKRRGLDGAIQDSIVATPEAALPPQSPLAAPGPHRLNPDTSVALAVATGFIPGESALARRTLESLESLWNRGWKGGGYGRYELSSEPDSPGPWPFPSLFVARAWVEAGNVSRAARVLRWLDDLPGAEAGSWFEFYGDRPSPPFPQVGIVPWTWAEFVFLLVHHVLGLRPGLNELRLRPRLLPGMDRVKSAFPLAGGWLFLDLERDRRAKSVRVETSGRILGGDKGEAVLSYPLASDLNVRLIVP
jgi:hypothetical protein